MDKLDAILELVLTIRESQQHSDQGPFPECLCKTCEFYRKVEQHFQDTRLKNG